MIQYASGCLIPLHFVTKNKMTVRYMLMTETYDGLLSGVSERMKTAQYYSDNISFDKAASLVLDKKRLFNICLENAKGDREKMQATLAHVVQNAKKFINSREVWDRHELIASLDNIINENGIFACVLAGKTTSKTLVLTDLQKRLPDKVFCVDLRENGPDILTGLLDVLKEKHNVRNGIFSLSETFRNLLVQVVVDCVNNLTSRKKIEIDFQKYIDIIKKSNDKNVLQKLILQLVEKLGPITLIIDEANLALTIDDDSTKEEIKATKGALALFTSLTKVKNQVSFGQA